jgi:acetoin utilization protein AcuB
MRLLDVMTKPVKSVSPDALAATAREQMRRDRIHHLVVRRNGDVVGVLSERDTRVDAAGERRVGEVMSAHVVTATSDTTVRQAANLMRGRSVGCLPIVDDGKLVGIVTVTDLLTALGRGAEREVSRGKRWTMKDRGPRKRTIVP